MPKIQQNVRNNPAKQELVTGFLGGLNTFQDENVLKDSELTEAKNILLSVDGIQPRPGTLTYGSSSGSKVIGGFGFYKSDGTRQFLRYATGTNNKLQKYVSGTPTDIGSTTFNASARMNFVQARDKVFIFNGQDNLSTYDGSSITTYTALVTPTNLAVSPQGTTGSTAYSYRVSAVNAIGETLAASSVAIANGNATLSATNFNRVSWTAVSGATGYNIWGRKATGLGESYITTVYGVTQYDDTGEFDPSLSFLPPEANTTQGVVGTMGIFAISRIFVAGNATYPSRLYFGGVGDNIANFSGSSVGGGGVDVFRNDGSVIRSILPFQGGVIIWKDNAIYKFSFTDDGLQKLEEITRSFGGISFRSCKHVENDVIFAAKKDGRLAFYSLGNQENYAGTVLRTNELSIKIAERLTEVNVEQLPNSASFYFENVYGCAVATEDSSTNNRIWCLDTRFGAWVYWEGINANLFTTYVDTDGTEKLYYGDESSGKMKEMFYAIKSDDGIAFEVEWTTKAFNQKVFHKIKKYYDPTFQFKSVSTSGALTGDIVLDGVITSATFQINQQSTGGGGFGVFIPGFHFFGDAPDSVVADNASSDVLVEVKTRKKARSIKYGFRSNTAGADYKFLSLAHIYKILEAKRLPSTSRTYIT
jgi:hypothetical protein